MPRSISRPLLVLIAVVAAAGCEREERRFRDSSPDIIADTSVRQTTLQPGVPTRDVAARQVVLEGYDENAWAISEGKRLYELFNCVGCHSHGGGSMGPPLLDDEWIYGHEPENIVATIMEGRPNGMPSFRGRVSPVQAGQMAAYVRSLSGLVPIDARPSRDDHMSYMPSLQTKYRPEKPKSSTSPPQTERP
jgi:cytochrome c oxidase cbb3-type subunit 3